MNSEVSPAEVGVAMSWLDGAGAVAGFLQQLAAGGFGERFAEEFRFVADDAGGDFDDRCAGPGCGIVRRG